MQSTKICSFFGHRNVNENVIENIYNQVIKVICEYNVTIFYMGNNGKFDSLAREAVIKAQLKFPSIQIYLIMAYMPIKKEEILEKNYDGIIYPEGLELVPRRFAIAQRNKWIANQSDIVIGYVKTSYGGAYEALRYAENHNKKIINLSTK